jgi:glycosyltransferase involved in cell wall biosynthesis
MFPTRSHNYYGIHVKEQIDGLKKHFNFDSLLFFINALEKGKLEYLKSLIAIKKSIKNFKPDIIHIHYGLSGLFLLFFRPKCKIFITLHGGDILAKQGNYAQVLLTKRILKKVDKAFILNSEMALTLSKLSVPFEILPCGVDVDFFNPNISNIDKEPHKTLVFPGDPNRKVKNYELFEKVVYELRSLYPHKLNIKTVHNLNREQVVDLLRNSDCLVMTSWSEGSPQIVKEALSCNLPVVSVPVGDVKEVLDELPGCFVAQNHSAKELAECVINSFDSDYSDLREKFINKRIYDNGSIINRLYKIYQD